MINTTVRSKWNKEKFHQGLVLAARIAGVSLLVAWLFYDSVFGLFWIGGIAVLFFRDWKREQARRECYELEKQFQTGLIFAAGSLEAGYSVENAWKEMEQEVVRLYGKEAVFARLLHEINQRIHVNEPMEMLVWEMGQNSQSNSVRSFSEVFFFARKSGGNMTVIMRRAANRISQNFQIQEEVQLALASKQLELMIMHIMPFGILGYLRIGSPSFLDSLYHNPTGVLIMTGCAALYLFAWWLSKKIIQIGV